MLVDVLTIACGLGLAYVFLIIIDTIRSIIISSIRARAAKRQREFNRKVYNYQNEQVEQPVKGGKKKNETKR